MRFSIDINSSVPGSPRAGGIGVSVKRVVARTEFAVSEDDVLFGCGVEWSCSGKTKCW